METWKPVAGWESLYEVSDQGRVRSLPRIVPRLSKTGTASHLPVRGRVMVGRIRPDGYRTVILSGLDIQVQARIHVLVLEAFVSLRPEGMQARHLNGRRDDNRLVNLAWGTPSENTQDCLRHGTHGMVNKTHCPAGHPYDEVHTRWLRGGTARMCRTCANAARRNKRAKDKALR